jgi:hypothetical protein
MKIVTAALAALLLAASLAYGADIDGKWEGSVMGPNGSPSAISYTFKADGNVLTGVVTGGGTDIKIRDGKIDRSNLSFFVDVEYGGQQMTFSYSGILSKDEIKLNAEVNGQPMEIVVKRAAKGPANKAEN